MDRILYFRMIGKKEYNSRYRVQVFRKEVHGKDLLYLQVCGYPKKEQVQLVQEEMQKAVSRILTYGKKDEEQVLTSLAYDHSFEVWLESLQCEKEWRRMWRFPVYDAYHEKEHVLHMLETIPKETFPRELWVLGYGSQMKEWIFDVAPKIRSLTFYVEFITRSLEGLAEVLEEEYGLVSIVKLVAPGALRKERLRSTTPVLIVDYSGTDVISVAGMCKGSVWMDMDSVEAKRHSMEDRRIGIQYISMKKIWKQEMLQPLDTISNFEYNTDVKLDGLGG